MYKFLSFGHPLAHDLFLFCVRLASTFCTQLDCPFVLGEEDYTLDQFISANFGNTNE